ncbi:MAG: UDP-N-acetylmuramoyl-tripeptide--D-alanyl-D-alanine ligase [Prevotella sp.]|nr:UDP-N-acetylmuramoyl-tripeptide--D-alanyl-D-alanine ligase [Prevotella sp.]
MEIKQLYKLYLEHPVITTDSRQLTPGSIFLALKGASFNGNLFAQDALLKGCSYAIVDEDVDVSEQLADRVIRVDDCLQTFKLLAREHRRQFSIPVIGITGTNGKTTTKELVAAVLAKRYNVMATEGNFNNDVGVPKTLFRLNSSHQIAIVEMGASHPGDIKTLVETAEPTCGLITNVGRAHLLGFGSFEGVKKTKGELYDFLAARNSLVFLNADNEHLAAMAAERNITNIYRYASSNDHQPRVVGEVVSCAPLLRFRWRLNDEAQGASCQQPSHEVQTNLIGTYNLDNLLAAISVGLHFGVEPGDINRALEAYKPSNNRSQLEHTASNHLIVDAYNANPTSMAAAIDNFQRMEVSPKMAILGKMGELGEVWQEEHRKVIARLQQAHFDCVWLVGEEFLGVESPYRRFADVEEVKAAIAEEQPKGYYILIKGSNSVKLFQLKDLL